ncbi:MAG: hypothetical protein AB7W16_19665 [Candidatus Obscuribacterales bacterium]
MRLTVKRAAAVIALGVAPLFAGPAGASDCKNGVCPDPGRTGSQLIRANPDQSPTMNVLDATTVAILLPAVVLLGAFVFIAVSKSGVFLQLLKDKKNICDSMKNR